MPEETDTACLSLFRRNRLWVAGFQCMASPCEVLIQCDTESEARKLGEMAQTEARRIEHKYSRYRDDNLVHRINAGERVEVDSETARLLDFAAECHALSDGFFDITSGILRRAWHYGPNGRVPKQADIEALLPRIGWHRVRWDRPEFQLPEGMEIDFGGIGKEYAVDSTLQLLKSATRASVMVNFGGDCHASGPLADDSAWMTGIEDPSRPGDASAVIRLRQGALATSGDVFRFVEQDGKRYGHILNPLTGWPDTDSPLSITVAAPTCTEAGILSTLAMLQGKDAEAFLEQQGFRYWCYR